MMDEESITAPKREGSALLWDESLQGRTVGEFLLHEKIGEGGYGFIYRAEQRALSREVVVKILRWRGAADNENTQRFLREATLASQLDHPYAAHIYSFGAEPDGLLWIAMEMVRGTSLKKLLEAQGSLPLRRLVPLLEKLCEVVYTAHQQGIIHRDIKPSNVMVLSRAGRLLPKLLDFGIARALADPENPSDDHHENNHRLKDSTPSGPSLDIVSTISDLIEIARSQSGDSALTRQGVSIGSPPYMAPEQWVTAARSDARTDQYALGVLAYEALTGRRPFRAPNPNAMAIAHASRAVPPLGTGFSPEIDQVIRRAMAKKASDRFDSVLELASAFRAAAGLESTSDPLPRLALSLRETMLARAPQPLADSVAMLEAARTPDRAVAAARQIIRVTLRIIGLLAIAATRRIGLDRSNTAAYSALRRLRKGHCSSPDWLELARVLVEPFVTRSDAYPIPEMVRLLSSPGATSAVPDDSPAPQPVQALIEIAPGLTKKYSAPSICRVDERTPRRTSDTPGAALDPTATHELLDNLASLDIPEPISPDAPRSVPRDELNQLLPRLAKLLGCVSFLCDYPWIVRKGVHNEAWVGARRPARAHVPLDSALQEGDVVLATHDGAVLLSLSPLCQLLTPAPGAHDEIFLFDGPSRFGAKLVSFPVGFERHDTEFWSWYRKNLVDLESGRTPAHGLISVTDAQRPYKGLTTFSPADADDYFGREREVHDCVNRLRISPLLAVVGPSGVGKSSFVQAGLLPAMPSYWRAITVRPGPAPLARLAAALEGLGVASDSSARMNDDRGARADEAGRADQAGDLCARLARDRDALGAWLRDRVDRSGEPLILIVDQFEELITLCHDPEERQLYAEALVRSARSSDDPVRVIITLRDDFLVRVQQLPALRERLQHTLQILSTPPASELERILVKPARRAGYDFEDHALPHEMVEAVADEPSALALLSFTASKLWEARDATQHRLTRRAYKELGGVGGALAQHAEETLGAMDAEANESVREVFRQLVTADGTRAILTRSELSQILGGTDRANPVLEALIGSRLLVASEGQDDQDRIEVVHEALLASWPRLVRWQREDAESARLRDQLRAAARQWNARKRPGGLLWHGDALLEYQVWRGRYRGALTDVEEAFAQASLNEEARGRRTRRTLAIAAFAVLVAGLLVVLHLYRQGDIQRERAEVFAAESAAAKIQAEASAAQARTSAIEANQRLLELYIERGRQHLLDGDPMRAFAYLAEARASGADDPATRFMLARAGDNLQGQEMVLPAHEGTVMWAELSPDGTRIATAGEDRTAKIWSAATGELLTTLEGHTKTVWMLDFSPDGQRIATASWDGSLRVWNPTTGALLWAKRHDDGIQWVGYTSDGEKIATASRDRTARIWDADTGDLLATLEGHSKGIFTAALSPAGDLLATGGFDHSVKLWSMKTGQLIRTIPDNRDVVVDIQFSPDGSRIALASYGEIARIAAIRSGPVLTLSGHTAAVTRVAFSSDGERLITSSEDGVAKVWNARTGAHLFDLEGHESGVTFAAFSPDDQTILTTSRDGTARTWKTDSQRSSWTFFGHQDGVWLAHFDEGGDRFLTAGFDGTVRIWNSRQTRYLQTFEDHDKTVISAVPSPEGDRIATAQEDGTVQIWTRGGTRLRAFQVGDGQSRVIWSPDGTRLLVSKGVDLPSLAGGNEVTVWDASSGVQLLRITGHGGKTIQHAAYDPRGASIITVGTDGTAVIRDARNGEERLTLDHADSKVLYAAFDPTGTRVVTAGQDNVGRIWNARTGERLHTLRGHGQAINVARFSPDGARVITAANDKTARLWTATGELVATMQGHDTALLMATFSRDGNLVVTAAEDGTTRVWDVANGKQLWSIDHHGETAWSVERMPGEALWLTTSGQRAALWRHTYDDRAPQALARFSRCRVIHALRHGSLEPASIDHQACSARRARDGARTMRSEARR